MTVLPEDNLIAHERRHGRCSSTSSAATAAANTADAAVLSMTDLFNYLLPYPTVFSHVIQNYHPLLIYLPSLL